MSGSSSSDSHTRREGLKETSINEFPRRSKDDSEKAQANLELRSTGLGVGPYVLLGWGIRPDFRFEGSFDDELFGVFVLDNDLTKIERTIDIFPTCRWADCIVSIERVAGVVIHRATPRFWECYNALPRDVRTVADGQGNTGPRAM